LVIKTSLYYDAGSEKQQIISWMFQKVEQKYVGSSEMWGWRRVEKINWTDLVKNEALNRVK
jgi:hypothetical protein